jgi:hypothetical protein
MAVESGMHGRRLPKRKRDVQTWPEAARSVAIAMMEKYGDPDEASGSLLIFEVSGETADPDQPVG